MTSTPKNETSYEVTIGEINKIKLDVDKKYTEVTKKSEELEKSRSELKVAKEYLRMRTSLYDNKKRVEMVCNKISTDRCSICFEELISPNGSSIVNTKCKCTGGLTIHLKCFIGLRRGRNAKCVCGEIPRLPLEDEEIILPHSRFRSMVLIESINSDSDSGSDSDF